jgi:methionyl-tRNA synthetase
MATRPETKDSNFSWEFFVEKINADLNDTFGNFIHRTLTFINSHFEGLIPKPKALTREDEMILDNVRKKVKTMTEDLEAARLQSAANTLISVSRIGNQYLNEKEPWNLVKKDKDRAAAVLYVTSQIVKTIAVVSCPFIPATAEKLWQTLNLPGSVKESSWEEALKPLESGHLITKSKPLFSKIDADEKQLDEMLSKIREKAAKEV